MPARRSKIPNGKWATGGSRERGLATAVATAATAHFDGAVAPLERLSPRRGGVRQAGTSYSAKYNGATRSAWPR
jgi:hypothetical protein